MGLENEGRNRNFLSLFKGDIVQRVPSDTPGAIKRFTKSGKEVHELHFNTLNGFIENVKVEDPPEDHKEYGRRWVFSIRDESNEYELGLPYSSSAANGILDRLMNVDFSKPVKIKSWYIEDDGNYKQHITVDQEGERIDKFFTKENPMGRPEPKQITIDGQPRLDFTDALRFMEKVVKEKIKPKIAEANPLADAGFPEEEVPPPNTSDIPPVNDDLGNADYPEVKSDGWQDGDDLPF